METHEKKIKRDIAPVLHEIAAQFPVVTIEGPRQSGKTTLARMEFSEYAYVNLEDLKCRRLAQEDPDGFFRMFPPPVIVDEVQRVPDLLSKIQVLADELDSNGQFILTGSHQPRLRSALAQSLAGRTGLLTLLPLSCHELASVGHKFDRDTLIYQGFMPRLYQEKVKAHYLYEGYYRTYVERDVRELINVSNQAQFELFMRLMAGRVGQVVNLEALSGDVGVTGVTLKKWLSVLEASHIIFRLPPYYRNFGKRFVKSPKVYFTDVGLATHLLGITDVSQVAREPLLGGLFENLVVMEALKARCNAGMPPNLYYLRDKRGLEVDLVQELGDQLDFIEIKSAATPDNSMSKNMNVMEQKLDEVRVRSKRVVYSGGRWPFPGGEFVNFADLIMRW